MEEINIPSYTEDDTILKASTSFCENKKSLFCAAIGCKSNKLEDPNVQLFQFPAQKKRYALKFFFYKLQSKIYL